MTGSDELLIGVIGVGGRGGLARHAHDPANGVRVVAGADVNPRAFERFRERFGEDVFTTDDYRRLLEREDIGAVFVTTPDYLHAEHAVAALAAGKDVFLEKPMAITIDDCDRILRTAFERKRKLYVGHNMRHIPFVKTFKRLVDEGAIGEVKTAWCRHFLCYGCDAYFKDWHADRSLSTGMLLQKAAHDIDVIHYICGGYTKRVNAMGGLTVYDRITDHRDESEPADTAWRLENWPPLSQKGLNPVVDIEDLSMMQMALDNGAFAAYQQCHYAPDGWRNYTFIGTEGRMENFGDYHGDATVCVWNKRTVYEPRGDVQIDLTEGTGGHGGADPTLVKEFVRYVRAGGKVLTSAVAARQAVAAGYQATMSIRDGGKPLDIPPLDAEVAAYFDRDVEG